MQQCLILTHFSKSLTLLLNKKKQKHNNEGFGITLGNLGKTLNLKNGKEYMFDHFRP